MTQHGTQQPPENVTSLRKVCVLHATDPLGVFLPPSYLSARAAFPIDVEGKHSLSNKKAILQTFKSPRALYPCRAESGVGHEAGRGGGHSVWVGHHGQGVWMKCHGSR